MRGVSGKSFLIAFGVVLGVVAAAGAYGGLMGYVGVLQSRHAPEQKRIRELKEALGKGVGGEVARGQIAELERQIARDSDPAPAIDAAKSKASTMAAIAFAFSLPFLIGWFYRRRLGTLAEG